MIFSLNAFWVVFQDKILYRATGREESMKYFHVDPDTGLISIKKLLYPGTTNAFEVRVLMCRVSYNMYWAMYYYVKSKI